MAHPYKDHKESDVGRRRAAKMVGKADGGAVENFRATVKTPYGKATEEMREAADILSAAQTQRSASHQMLRDRQKGR